MLTSEFEEIAKNSFDFFKFNFTIVTLIARPAQTQSSWNFEILMLDFAEWPGR